MIFEIRQFAAVLLVGSCVGLSAGLPACVCTREGKPVCGSDGQTCKREAPCFCTFESRPLCASDGQTYANECELRCRQAEVPSLRVSHEGECRAKRQAAELAQHCTCPRSAKPVCGSDGNTYTNPCLLNCASEAEPSLFLQHPGPCSNDVSVVEQPQETPSCTCARDYKPVCATNGVTFDNMCLMRCAGEHLSVQSFGPCEPSA
ncbi:unnamed protein product, partial [Iphiclides podalirius]